MKRRITIDFNWWTDDKKDIDPEVQEILEQKALEHIKEMWGQGFTQGELNENIRMTVAEPKFGIDYRGHWSLTTENPPVEPVPCTIVELTPDEAKNKMDLVYLEAESGFHIGLDASYLEQMGDFKIKLPTGEIIDTKNLPE